MELSDIFKPLISVLPPALYVLIYFGRLRVRKSNILYAESFLYGIIVSLGIILFNSLIHGLFVASPYLVKSFVFAAMVEKTAALLSVSLLVKSFRNTSVSNAMCVGMFFAAGFSFTENIHYAAAFGNGAVFQRMFFAVPMHIVTCAVAGFFLALRELSVLRSRKIRFAIYALFIPVIIHGTYDYFSFWGGYSEYVIPPFVIALIVYFEWMISFSRSVPSMSILKEKKLSYEEWIILLRHQRHEKWIHRAMGKKNQEYSGLIRLNPGMKDVLKSVAVMAFGVILVYNYETIVVFASLPFDIKSAVMIFVSLPVTVSLALIMKGVINPEYFTNGILRIPVIANAVINPYRENEETLVTYDITMNYVFIKGIDLPVDRNFDIIFEVANSFSPLVTVEKKWENDSDHSLPVGMIVSPSGMDENSRMKLFLKKYYRIKYISNLIYALRIPGKWNIRRYFINRTSVMKNRISFPKGSVIYTEGDSAEHFYQIEKGRIGIYMKGDDEVFHKVSEIKGNGFFGESDIAVGNKRMHKAVAETDCELKFAGVNELKTIVNADPHFAYQIILSLARRVGELEKKSPLV